MPGPQCLHQVLLDRHTIIRSSSSIQQLLISAAFKPVKPQVPSQRPKQMQAKIMIHLKVKRIGLNDIYYRLLFLLPYYVLLS